MNWLTKLFRPKPLSQSDRDFFDACNAFATAEKIWKDAVQSKGSRESELNKIKEALKFFDEAIKKGLIEPTVFHHGFDESEAFSLRGSCLDDLGFYFEAFKDYNRAIEKGPRKAIAATYFRRGMVRKSLFDFEGSSSDLKEAIRLSALDNDDNRYWNKHYAKIGFSSQSAFYATWLPTEVEIISNKRYTGKILEEELRKIKRRGQ